MAVNPLNVIQLLMVAFNAMNIPQSNINDEERELAKSVEQILKQRLEDFTGIEIVVENTLDFQEMYKNCESVAVEDTDLTWNPKTSDEGVCTKDDDTVDYEYKKRAVEFWRSGKTQKNLGLKTVQSRFRDVKSERQLRRWAGQVNKGGTFMEKLKRVSDYTLNKFQIALDAGMIIHDSDIRKWALHARKLIGFDDSRFKASHWWIWRFKVANRITSRKITKFISRKTLETKEQLEHNAEEFLNEIRPLLITYGKQNVYNSDQSGFQLEMHSGRTLAVEGEKKVECIVQSVSSITHSYTIQPTISADGKLLSPLFLVLKEPSGKFGPIVEKTIFRPINVFVTASKSGKLTSDHFRLWLENVFFPNVGTESVLLIDSWSGHCPEVVQNTVPTGKTIKPKIIPKGTTGKIQPLDVYGFRTWKNFVKHFSDTILLMDYDMNLHLRNNIIKLHSLVHNQLSSPRYTNLFRYSWYKCGYVTDKPGHFENPVDFSFETTGVCDIPGCDNVAIIRCSWCKKSLCFQHFFEEHHYCTTYNP